MPMKYKHTLMIPPHRPRLVFVAFGVYVTTLLWLGIEDTSLLPPILLALGLTVSVGYRMLLYLRGGHVYEWKKAITGGMLLGALGGFGTTVVTVLLMFLKTAMHSHAYPDYPPQVMAAVFMRAPAWTATGALVGLGIVLLWIGATAYPPDH